MDPLSLRRPSVGSLSRCLQIAPIFHCIGGGVSRATRLVFEVVFSFKFAEFSRIILSSIIADEEIRDSELGEYQLQLAYNSARWCRT